MFSVESMADALLCVDLIQNIIGILLDCGSKDDKLVIFAHFI